MDGYSNGFDINQIRNEMEMKMQQIKTEIMQQIRAEIMQQIRAECNCKNNDYNYNLDSKEYYDD